MKLNPIIIIIGIIILTTIKLINPILYNAISDAINSISALVGLIISLYTIFNKNTPQKSSSKKDKKKRK